VVSEKKMKMGIPIGSNVKLSRVMVAILNLSVIVTFSAHVQNFIFCLFLGRLAIGHVSFGHE
jgi:hypothetical protein